MILFGDFKQLPPATSKPPFIAIPNVHHGFDYRVLRQNRRVVADEVRKDEIEAFHGVLFDVAHGISSGRVRDFIVQAYPGSFGFLIVWDVTLRASFWVRPWRRLPHRRRLQVGREHQRVHQKTLQRFLESQVGQEDWPDAQPYIKDKSTSACPRYQRSKLVR